MRAWALTLAVMLCGSTDAEAAPASHPTAAALSRRVVRQLDDWNFREAEALLGLLEVTAPQDPSVAVARARHHYLFGRYAEAQALLQRLPKALSLAAARARALGSVEAVLQVTRLYETHRSASGNFVFRYPKGLESILLPYATQALERIRAVLAKELGLVPDGPVRVEIHPGAEELAATSPLTLEEIRRTGTTALCRDHRIMIVTPRSLVTGYGWLDTLAHEYVHYVLEVKARHRVPLWLHEGLASHLMQLWREPYPTTLSVLEQHRLATGLRAGRLVPLQRMMPSFAKLKDHQEAALAYAQVASMVLHLHRRHGVAALRRLLESLAAGDTIDRALRQVTGVALQPFLARWRAALRAQGPKPVPAFSPPERRYKKAAPRGAGSPRTPFGRYRRLGAILRARGHTGAAVVEYRKALEAVQGTHGETANILARLLLRQGAAGVAAAGAKEAAQVIDRALPYSSGLAALRVARARAALALGRPRVAERHLWRANGIDPFDAEIHCRLAELLQKRGDGKAAQERTACRRLTRAR
ncbi:MAG: hypothetical protein ABI333_09910 [bacterium]